MFVGFQDELALRYGHDRQQMLDVAWHANATVIRAWIEWDKIAPTRPANPRDPFDPAYVMTDTDDLVRAAQMRGMEVLFTIWGTPAWANGGAGANRAPTGARDLEDFSYAIASRYSGRYAGYPVRPLLHGLERAEPARVPVPAVRRARAVGGARALRAPVPRRLRGDQGREPAGAGRARRHVAVGERRRRLAPARHASPALLSRLRPRLPLRRLGAPSVLDLARPAADPARALAERDDDAAAALRGAARALVRPAARPDLDHRVRLPDAAAGRSGVTYAQQAAYLGRR